MSVESNQKKTPLSNLTIAITGSRRANELAHIVTRLGGKPYIAPTIAIQAPPSTEVSIHQFIAAALEHQIDLVLVMTGPGIQAVIREAEAMRCETQLLEALSKIPFIARSGKPQQVLTKHGVNENVTLPEHETVEACFELALTNGVKNKRVAVIWHGANSRNLVQKLTTAGAQVLEVSTYQYSDGFDKNGTRILKSLGYNYVEPDTRKALQLIQTLIQGHVQVITFTSPPAVENLFRIAAEHNLTGDLCAALNRSITVAIGPSTKHSIEQHDVHVKVVPETYKMGAMVASLVRFIEQSQINPESVK